MVQLHAPRQATLCEKAKLRDDELVELSRSVSVGERPNASTFAHLLGTQLHAVLN